MDNAQTTRTSPFQIERGGVRIEIIDSDPDGLTSYDRSFLVKYAKAPKTNFAGAYAELTIRDAWDIAKFLTRHVAKATRLQAIKRTKNALRMIPRPKDNENPWTRIKKTGPKNG